MYMILYMPTHTYCIYYVGSYKSLQGKYQVFEKRSSWKVFIVELPERKVRRK